MGITPRYLLPPLPDNLQGLTELALDLRWAWNHITDPLWEHIDPRLWKITRNPWMILQTASDRRIAALSADPAFVVRVDEFVKKRRLEMEQPGWFRQTHGDAPLHQIAYFSMEFGLSEALPIYAGGLGMLAGDTLKTAHDLDMPMVAVGLLYQQGYFRQELDPHGWQVEMFPYNDPSQLPILPVRDADGEWLCVEIPFPGRGVRLRAWQAKIGRVTLYLLDSNDPANLAKDRGITGELYGGGSEMRLQQEICLGIGGWRLLRQLKIDPEICHLNEGHAAFAILARAGGFMADHQVDFATALNATRAGNIFTTHTPVAAGFDCFTPDLLAGYFQTDPPVVPIPLETLLALGRVNPHDGGEHFNMAYLAVRGSMFVNGVSRLHGEVSRAIFQPLFPRWPWHEVPVTHVTNGVHVPSWDSPAADQFWTQVCGQQRWLGDLQGVGSRCQAVSDQMLWTMRTQCRQQLISFARERFLQQRQLTMARRPQEDRREEILDFNTLTMGFARRFTAYKRPNLLLSDPARLLRMLMNRQYPVQFIIAGKAHPQDTQGKLMVQAWTRFIADHPGVERKLIFLEDYDILLAEQLVQGVDLWINTSRRPWEASGTSGMKILANGGLNCSQLDGWWAEAFKPEVGWALGDRCEHADVAACDARDATALYNLLESQIIPDFYQDRDVHGCPKRWLAKMRASMSQLTPQFSTNRMLREYARNLYLPAAALYHSRRAGNKAAAIGHWRMMLAAKWNQLRFGELRIVQETQAYHFSVPVYLGDIDPDFIAVELYAEPLHPGETATTRLNRGGPLEGAVNGFTYEARIAKTRQLTDYTPRIIPAFSDVCVPMEAPWITWYR